MDLPDHLLEPYGTSLAKIGLGAIDELADRPQGKYVVVTAITPTPLGEGKTTTTVGLGQAMQHIGQRAVIASASRRWARRSASRAAPAGGGYSQVIPMELLNLHLTGDFHAVTAAHNLLAAMLDNHLHQGNELGLDLDNITWRRVLDVNDRALRNIIVGLGAKEDGVVRQTGFDITAASEVMAILALATSLDDLRARLGASSSATRRPACRSPPSSCEAAGSMAVIMREAIKPNLLQTLEHTPVIVHAGPFGNIAHGNSSVVGDLIGIHGGDYLVTEAGFGADMGAERFFNIKCRASGLAPDAAVLVATVRALKAHSGRYRDRRRQAAAAGDCSPRTPTTCEAGAANLAKQIENVKVHGVTPVVAINAFPTDHPSEHAAIRSRRRVARRPCRRVHALRRRRRRRHRAGRGRRRGVRRAERLPLPLPRRATRSSRRSRRSPPRIYGAGRVDYTAARRPAARRRTSATGSATCRCASPRPTCRSRPTPR